MIPNELSNTPLVCNHCSHPTVKGGILTVRHIVALALALTLGSLIAGACSQANSKTSDDADSAQGSPTASAATPPTLNAKPADQAKPRVNNPTPTTAASATPTATTSPPPPLPAPTPIAIVLPQEPLAFEETLEVAQALAANMILPSDCGNPLPRPDLLPNSPRSYRSGIHQGVDFVCPSLGRSAVAALDGRVVQIMDNYRHPTPNDRLQLLGVAAQLAATPPFTLLSLYGNYVVIDHGITPFAGHIISIYAHLHEVDSNIRIGQTISAGERVGEIGNSGTAASAAGDVSKNVHLHWELHLNNLYLGADLSTQQTREVYTTLFAEAMR